MAKLRKLEKEKKLEKGVDSGPVGDTVKKHVLAAGAGICAWPECENRIVQELTMTGECAHIIPKIVGSNDREDYVTPLEDRRKAANLLYLCRIHHPIADNNTNACKYPADLLRAWKKIHEEWAAKEIRKNNSHLPQDMQTQIAAALEGMTASISEQSKVAYGIINSLLDKCRTYIARNLITDAELILNELEILLVDSNSDFLRNKFRLNSAALLVRKDRIPEARTAYEALIKVAPEYIDALGEYAELQLNFATKEKQEILDSLKAADSKHPVLEIQRLVQSIRSKEKLKPEVPRQFSSDFRLNGRILIQRALIYDQQEEKALAEDYLTYLSAIQPTSPRPYYFRAIFRADETFKKYGKDTTKTKSALDFSKEQRKLVYSKDPLLARDKLNWDVADLQLSMQYAILSGEANLPEEQRNEAINLITRCYFDSFINDLLPSVIGNFKLTQKEWIDITAQIANSDFLPDKGIIDQFFVQGLKLQLNENLDKFINRYQRTDLKGLLSDIKNKNADNIAAFLNNKADYNFTLLLLECLPPDIQIVLPDKCELPEGVRPHANFIKIKALSEIDAEQAIKHIEASDFDQLTVFELHEFQRLTYSSSRPDLFIKVAEKMLKYEGLEDDQKLELNAQLASAHFNADDDSGAIKHATEALNKREHLNIKNSQLLLLMLMRSYSLKGQHDKAVEAYEQYADVQRNAELLYQASETYLKTLNPNHLNKAFDTIQKFYKVLGKLDDKLFFQGFLILNELALLGFIEMKNKEHVTSNNYIQLDNGNTDWYYIGDGYSYGALEIKSENPIYHVLINQPLGQEIEWPPYKFSQKDKNRRIIKILELGPYLKERAGEGMSRLAKLGTEPIWELNLDKEDGSFDLGKLKAFMLDTHKRQHEFLEKYAKDCFPFAFLCKIENGIVSAIARIQNEKKGFIKSNNGSPDDLLYQKAVAKKIIRDAEYVIDPLTLIMLAESQILPQFLKAAPNLRVATSTIRQIRNIATSFEGAAGSTMRGNIARGELQFHERDSNVENGLRNKLLQAADLIDTATYKLVAKKPETNEQEQQINKLIPAYFLEPFKLAKDGQLIYLSEDQQLFQAYQLTGINDLPERCCSWAAVREMAESGAISWHDYRRYYGLLASYRFHTLPLTVDDLINAIVPESKGIFRFEPKNLYYFNLRYTLSAEYGVSDETAISVLIATFQRLLNEESLTKEMADEVFPILITECLAKRNAKVFGTVILNVCQKSVITGWNTKLASEKFEILAQQLDRYAADPDPLINQIPGLLRILNKH